MVVRIHGISGQILPTLPESGCTIGKHKAPAWICSLGGNPESLLLVTIFSQHLKKILRTEVARRQMIIMRNDIGDKVVHNPLNPVFRNYAEEEGKGIRSLVVAAVATGLLVPVLAIDSCSGLFGTAQ